MKACPLCHELFGETDEEIAQLDANVEVEFCIGHIAACGHRLCLDGNLPPCLECQRCEDCCACVCCQCGVGLHAVDDCLACLAVV